ncbi:hypothetical protein ARMGADRAFT_1031914 [Armillaria gallica]|uniref:Uncharacterized protein n=1 Tax=Armillaria gallica TaxID=47427 RepID=A0A2H3DIE2_ARMGA|nr:hypothetical protein ARMGADRAFT_1031914 [Armillaria gallica]
MSTRLVLPMLIALISHATSKLSKSFNCDTKVPAYLKGMNRIPIHVILVLQKGNEVHRKACAVRHHQYLHREACVLCTKVGRQAVFLWGDREEAKTLRTMGKMWWSSGRTLAISCGWHHSNSLSKMDHYTIRGFNNAGSMVFTTELAIRVADSDAWVYTLNQRQEIFKPADFDGPTVVDSRYLDTFSDTSDSTELGWD